MFSLVYKQSINKSKVPWVLKAACLLSFVKVCLPHMIAPIAPYHIWAQPPTNQPPTNQPHNQPNKPTVKTLYLHDNMPDNIQTTTIKLLPNKDTSSQPTKWINRTSRNEKFRTTATNSPHYQNLKLLNPPNSWQFMIHCKQGDLTFWRRVQ